MFGDIATRYDRANRFLSGGIDLYWRKRLVQAVAARQPAMVADLATGSGDVAFALQRRLGASATVHGYDFSEPMLDEARRKQQDDLLLRTIPFAFGDCLDLPLASDTVDAVTIAFGLRNLEDRAAGLREMRRILVPGGALHVLEFTQPDAWMRPFYFLYLKALLPSLARLLTGNKDAYDYLAGSIESFPPRAQIKREIADAGFDPVQATGLTGGIVALHLGIKAK